MTLLILLAIDFYELASRGLSAGRRRLVWWLGRRKFFATYKD